MAGWQRRYFPGRADIDDAERVIGDVQAGTGGLNPCHWLIEWLVGLAECGEMDGQAAGGTEVQVGQIARREGMLGLGDSAIELVNKGVTSLEEAARIIMAD